MAGGNKKGQAGLNYGQTPKHVESVQKLQERSHLPDFELASAEATLSIYRTSIRLYGAVKSKIARWTLFL
jgi:hypothetical protein